MRISKYLIRSFFAVFAVVFGWIYVYGIGKTDENPCVVLGIMIGMGFAFYKITQWIYKVDDEKIRKWKKILFPLGIAFFGLQVCFTMVFRTENLYGWDFDTVIYLAKSYVEGTEGVSYHYLAAYSTNILYFWLVVAVFRVSSFLFGKCLTEMILILNIITLDFVIWGGYEIVKRMRDERQALITVLMCAGFSPYWLYLPIAYQDIFSMPFYILPMLLLIWTKKDDVWWKWVLIGILGGIGLKFKGNTAIITIAIGIWCIVRNNSWRKTFKHLVLLIVSFSTTVLLFGKLISCMDIISQEEVYQSKIPMTHLVYMGLTGDGRWNAEVVDATVQSGNYDEKVAFTTRKIKEAIQEYGADGLFWHITRKESLIMWNDGMLNGDAYVARVPVHDKVVNYILVDNSWINCLFRYYSRGYWRLLLVLALAGAVRYIKKPLGDEMQLNYIITFGTILLFAFWECNARYLVNSSIFIVMMGVDTLVMLRGKRGIHRSDLGGEIHG